MYNVKKNSNLIHPHTDSVLSARIAEKPAIPAKRVLLKSTQVYTGTFAFALQMYIYPYIIGTTLFDYCCFEVSFKIRKCEFLNFLFFSNSIFDILGPLQLHLHFKSVHQFLQRYHVNKILKRFYQNCTNLGVLTS